MDRRFFVTALAGAAGARMPFVAAAQRTSWRSQLLGAWSLINAISLTDGKLKPWFGRTPPITGILMYLDNGWMSVQIAGARPETNPANFDDLPANDRTKWLGQYYAYYGRFEIDEAARVVTHHITDSLLPYERAAVYRRKFDLHDDVLTLITEPWQDGSKTGFNRLIWKRMA